MAVVDNDEMARLGVPAGVQGQQQRVRETSGTPGSVDSDELSDEEEYRRDQQEIIESGVPLFPDLRLAQLRFELANETQAGRQKRILSRIMEKITEHKMTPFYIVMCEEFPEILEKDHVMLAEFVEDNKKTLDTLQERLDEALRSSAGETEISEALAAKAEHFARIGDPAAMQAYEEALERTPGLGARIDLGFAMTRVGYFFRNRKQVAQKLAHVKSLIGEGGDWDRRNRYRIYEAVFLMWQRDFVAATPLFLEALATFTSLELVSNAQFLMLSVLSSVLTLARPELKKNVISSPDINEFMDRVSWLREYMEALYECRYNQFFLALAQMEKAIKKNSYLNQHVRYYVREMRIKAYNQLLASYRSLTLDYMASAFGVTVDFVDQDIASLVACGRLHCTIDRVRGVVETNRPDAKTAQYQQLIKQSDILLNRVQKLGRISINVV